MRRAVLHLGVWAVATSMAVAVSWFGVRSVLRSTAYGPPRALPLQPAATGSPPGISTAVHRPKPSTAPPTSPTTRPRPTPTRSSTPTPTPTPTPTNPGTVHSYTLSGGQVVLSLTTTSASLVSATPNPTWTMQLWTDQPGWLRVTFTSASGTTAATLLATWNAHPPTVQTYEDH
ncbi:MULTISPECIES: hypothetical protein [Streptomycetaceae]|uniref:hypothetical protein n=1 Tax=Streptomycetaceae TaxID=2062 RepID=UPI00300BCD39